LEVLKMMAYRVRKICKALVVPGVPKPGFGSCIAQGGLFIVLKGGYLCSVRADPL
jgi:hypothetical protein